MLGKWRRIAVAAGGLAVLTALSGFADTAMAARVYPVKTGQTPSSGKPIQGGGSWVVNAPSRYYLGRIRPNERFARQLRTPGDWSWGRSLNGTHLCGWVVPKSIQGKPERTVGNSCSEKLRGQMAHRRFIGKDFNGYSGKTAREKGWPLVEDGAQVTIKKECVLHYNYFKGNDFRKGRNGGRLADPAGPISPHVSYRFTTLDNKAVVIRDPKWGWGFVPIDCVNRPTTLWNDND